MRIESDVVVHKKYYDEYKNLVNENRKSGELYWLAYLRLHPLNLVNENRKIILFNYCIGESLNTP